MFITLLVLAGCGLKTYTVKEPNRVEREIITKAYVQKFSELQDLELSSRKIDEVVEQMPEKQRHNIVDLMNSDCEKAYGEDLELFLSIGLQVTLAKDNGEIPGHALIFTELAGGVLLSRES